MCVGEGIRPRYIALSDHASDFVVVKEAVVYKGKTTLGLAVGTELESEGAWSGLDWPEEAEVSWCSARPRMGSLAQALTGTGLGLG